MLGDKLRFRFRKVGDLRLLSHHDMMRCLERMLRRAGIPFKSTAGFHPGPRIVFALSLPLGVDGTDEVLELELLHPCDSESVRTRMNAAAPAGLEFTRAAVVPMKSTAVPRRVEYGLPVPADRTESLSQRCAELLANAKIWVERQKPNPKRLNIRPYLRSLRVDADTLVLDLWVTGTGTARADELLDLLGVKDLLEAGAVLERRALEIRDEHPPGDPADQPPDGPAESEPLEPRRVVAEPAEPNQPAGVWDGPVVE